MKKMSLTSKAVRNAFGANKRSVFLLMIAVIGSVLFSLIPPQILRMIIDNNLAKGISGGLKGLAVLYLASAALCGLCDFTKGVMLTNLGQQMIKNLRLEMMRKMHRLPMEFFSKNSSGSIMGRFNNDVEHVDSLFSDGAIGLLVDSLKMIGIVISISMFNVRLGIAVLLLIPFIYLITRAFQKYMLKAQKENLVELGEMNGHLEDSVKNIRTIKSYCREKWVYRKYKDLLEKNYRTIRKVNFCDAIYSPIIQIIKAFVIAGIVYSVSDHHTVIGITVGMTAASIDLISNLFAPIESLGTEFQNIQDGVSAINRINSFGNEPEVDKKDGSLTAGCIMDGFSKDCSVVSAEHLTFSYDNSRTQVLDDVSFSIKRGEYVTITGRTGVGKTTLLMLVTGLFTPSGGCVKIFGTDAGKIPDSIKRSIFGYVTQDMKEIPGTIIDQVTLKDPNVTREQAIEAIKFTGLYDELEGDIDRTDTSLSQGQKQLLGIARAIAPDPPILLFDEITSSLDSMTEERIVSVLKKAAEHHTVLSVSHRLTSLKNSDQLIYLENGRVRVCGTPDEVLAQIPDFEALIKLQENGWS